MADCDIHVKLLSLFHTYQQQPGTDILNWQHNISIQGFHARVHSRGKIAIWLELFFHFQSHAIIIFREFIHQQEHIINVSIFNKHSLPFNFQSLAT